MLVAVAALFLAVPVALYVAWPLRRRQPAAVAVPAEDPRGALEADKRLALLAIRELDQDREAGLLAADDYAELRARYEAQATVVLRQIDALGPPPPVRDRPAAARSAPAAPLAVVPWTQRPLVLGGGVVVLLVFGVVLGVLAVRYTSPDAPASMAGARVPGGPAGPGGGTAEAEGPATPLPPAMLTGMLKAAHESLDAGRYQEAISAYKAILKREPQNVEAITHLGIILSVAGHAEGALEAFDKALAIDPDYAHALWDKARVLEERQDYAGAIAAWERFVKVGPPGQDRDQALARIREARARLAAKPAAGAASPPPTSR